jgi:solute carrier family 25 phosphate transporter 23/24/25/41
MPVGETDLTTPLRLTAGAMAGITSVVMTYPLDITRTRLSVQSSSLPTIRHPPTTTTTGPIAPGSRPPPPKLPGMFPTIAKIYRTEGGIPALYRGLLPTVLGVAPYVGLNFAVYEHVRKMVTPQGQKNPSAVGKLVAGGISGAVAQTITYPMDVLRRRFQVFIPDNPRRRRILGRNTVRL